MNAQAILVTQTSQARSVFALLVGSALLSPLACGGEVFSTGDADVDGATGGRGDGSGGDSQGSGGSTATGGVPGGTGGDTGTGGAGGCAAGQVTFVVKPKAPGASCLPDCGQLTPTISGEFGQAMRVTSQCTTSCGECAPIACALAPCLGGMYFDEETSFVWDGTTYTSSTCGEGFGCDQAGCSAPGQYTAQFCVPRASADSNESFCSPSAEKDCKTVTFTWPTDEQIVVDLSAP